jgi:type I restriction enzyme S subunit
MDYKKTDIGTIPHHWKIKKLGELGLIKGRIGWRGYTIDDLTESGPYV